MSMKQFKIRFWRHTHFDDNQWSWFQQKILDQLYQFTTQLPHCHVQPSTDSRTDDFIITFTESQEIYDRVEAFFMGSYINFDFYPENHTECTHA